MAAGELVSTGIVEIERDGCIYRGHYRTDGKTTTVAYGALKRTAQNQGAAPYTTARSLLKDIVSEIHPRH